MDTTTMTALDPAMQGPLSNEPDAATMLRQNLEEKHLAMLSRRDELLAAVERAPQIVNDEDTAKRVADFVKQIAAAHKNAETTRVSEKEPHLAAGRVVDGWFKSITDPLAKAKAEIERRLTIYQRAKAEAERRAREEAERLAREAARKAAEEAAAREAAMKTEADVQSAIAAADAAEQAAKDALAAQQAAAAKAAELSRTRGEFGAVASLRTFWDFCDLDRDKIDLEALRPYLATADIEKAVRGAIKAGARSIRGVTIFENTSTVVR